MEREQDETEYLCNSPANRERLEMAVENVKQGQNIISFDTLEQAKDCAEKIEFVDASPEEVMTAGDGILDKYVSAFKTLA
jgi:hypothetical protein